MDGLSIGADVCGQVPSVGNNGWMAVVELKPSEVSGNVSIAIEPT